MVSDTLYPAVYILETFFFLYLISCRAVQTKGTMSYRTEGENFHLSVGSRGFVRGDRGAWSMVAGAWSKELGPGEGV